MQQYMPFNPYLTPQQRLLQMEQQYPQLAQPQMPVSTATVNNNLVAIPVTNMEEANAFRVDPNGTPTLFYNAGKNEVYLKRTNTQTGLADFIKFAKLELATTTENAPANTKPYEKDFKALNDKIDSFGNKINELFSLLANENKTEPEEIKIISAKGGKNVK